MNPIKNPIKDPVKDTLVPLRTNFNANGSVRWRTSVYLNLFHWPRTSIDMDGTLNFDWSHLGGRILA